MRGLTAKQAVAGLVDGSLESSDLLAWLEQEEAEPNWDEMAADQRFLDPEAPNDEVTGPSRLVVLVADIGAPEQQRGTLLCAFSTVARNGCYDFGAGLGDMVVRIADNVPLVLTLGDEGAHRELQAPWWSPRSTPRSSSTRRSVRAAGRRTGRRGGASRRGCGGQRDLAGEGRRVAPCRGAQ